MSFGIKLHVWGEYACFTRPEMKVERVSYDVITPSSARGILDAIHWKPAIKWVVDRIHVLKEIRFLNHRRNELSETISAANVKSAMRSGKTEDLAVFVEDQRQQRATTLLHDVAYVIEAHFELTSSAQPDDVDAKHLAMFKRRASLGQCFHRPYLGTREFAAEFSLVDKEFPASTLPKAQRNRDLGWMLHDIEYSQNSSPRFFRAIMKDGIINVPSLMSTEVKS